MYNMEEVEREIQELVQNSRAKRCTVLEPCNNSNLSQCLVSVREEMGLLGIKFHWDPHSDAESSPEVLVRLVNACWGLLRRYKDGVSETVRLRERTLSLQQNNMHINSMVDRLTEETKRLERRARAAEEAQRAETVKREAAREQGGAAEARLRRLESVRASQQAQGAAHARRLEAHCTSLEDKLRGKCGVYVSKNEAKNTYVEEFRAKEKKYKETIAELQENNKRLLLEVISMREELLDQDSSTSEA